MSEVAEESVAVNKLVFVLLTVRVIVSNSSSVNTEDTSILRSGSSSMAVTSAIGFVASGQSLIWVI